MLILVTGATGFIGSAIARSVASAGHRVRALSRHASPLDLLAGVPIEIAHGDILDPASLDSAMAGVDVVFHAAASMRGEASLQQRVSSHVQGTGHILGAARRAGVARLVYVSSVAALGIPDGALSASGAHAPPMDERHAWNAPPDLWPYGYAKHRAETEVLAAAANGLDAVVVNPSIVLGAGDRNRVSNALVWQAAQGRVPPVIPGGVGVVHVEDVADGALAAMARGRTGERYILNGENLSVEQLVALAAEVAGARPPRWHISLRTARALARLADGMIRLIRPEARPALLELAGRYFYYNNRKAREELGIPLARSARAGATEALAWYRRAAEHDHSDRRIAGAVKGL